jgi:hypothetical protein
VGSLEAGGADPTDDDPGKSEVLRVRVRARVKSKWDKVHPAARRAWKRAPGVARPANAPAITCRPAPLADGIPEHVVTLRRAIATA